MEQDPSPCAACHPSASAPVVRRGLSRTFLVKDVNIRGSDHRSVICHNRKDETVDISSAEPSDHGWLQPTACPSRVTDKSLSSGLGKPEPTAVPGCLEFSSGGSLGASPSKTENPALDGTSKTNSSQNFFVSLKRPNHSFQQQTPDKILSALNIKYINIKYIQ